MELFNAIENENVDEVKILLKNGVNPNIYDRFNISTPLFEAIHEYIMRDYMQTSKSDIFKIIKLLLKYGADPNKLNNEQFINSPFIFSASLGKTIIVKLLLENGADPFKIIQGKPVIEIIRENSINRVPEIVDFIIEYTNLLKAQQNLAFASSLNPRLGYDTPINYLDYESIIDILSNPIRTYNPSLNLRIKDELRRDKLTKSKQKSAIMRGMETTTGPFRGIRYEPNIMEGISRHLSTMRPNTIAQRNMMLEDENDRIADYLNTLDQYGMGKRKGKRSKRKYARNRYR